MTRPQKYSAFLINRDFDEKLLNKFFEFVTTQTLKANTAIYINSEGGEVEVLNSIVALMHCTKTKWHTVAVGSVFSAALGLYAHGSYRYASPDARFMFHAAWGGITETADAAVAKLEAEELEKTSEQYSKRLVSVTKKPYDWWCNMSEKDPRREYYFSARRARELGLVNGKNLQRWLGQSNNT